MATRIISTKGAPIAVGPYSQAVEAGGFVFCSGQIPIDPKDGAMVSDDIQSATERVIQNLRAVLAGAGVDLASVVKTTVYLSDMDDFAGMNEVFEKYFGEAPPTRVCVEVSRLPKGALVEIEAIARIS
ncbi:MAG: RidA family protein [Planctomycetota bacterium]